MNKKMTMIDIIVEVIRDQHTRLKEVEKEIVRKYKNNEDFSAELKEAQGLKLLMQEGMMELAREKQRSGV